MLDHLSLQFMQKLETPDGNLEYSRFNLNNGGFNFPRTQVANINCKRTFNMTMDEAWEYISILYLIQLCQKFCPVKPKLRNILIEMLFS